MYFDAIFHGKTRRVLLNDTPESCKKALDSMPVEQHPTVFVVRGVDLKTYTVADYFKTF